MKSLGKFLDTNNFAGPIFLGLSESETLKKARLAAFSAAPSGSNWSEFFGSAALFDAFDTIDNASDATALIGSNLPGAVTAVTAGDVNEYIPKIEVGWGMAFDTWNFNLMGGFNAYEIEDVTSNKDKKTNDIDVYSYVVGGDIGWNFGPGYVKAALSYGQNIGNAGWSIASGVNGRAGTYQGGIASWDGDDDTDDVDTFMGALVGGIKVSDMLSFEGGIGYRSDDLDAKGAEKTQPWAVYVQSVIALAPGVYVIPEVGYYDFDDTVDDKDAGDLFYLGAKWQINF